MTSASEESPLVDTALANELFFPQGDEESDAMQRDIWLGISRDLIPDLEATVAGCLDAKDLRSELHRIRGYCATCALVRMSRFLHRWEMLDDPVGAAEKFGLEAAAIARESIREMDRTYPHLQVPPA